MLDVSLFYASCGRNGAESFVAFDAASIVGLPDAKELPQLRTTRGIGEALRQLFERGERIIVLGLGGTSTMDGGAGLLAEVALNFYDKGGQLLRPTFDSLDDIARIERRADSQWLDKLRLVALTDVTNPLNGPNGASLIFGAQKGFTDLSQADHRLANFAERCESLFGLGYSKNAGAGAAGGLGFAMSLLGAELLPGAEFIASMLNLHERMANFDWVITGEGCSDHQTLMGKGPSHIAALAHSSGVPVSLLSGAIKEPQSLSPFFDGCFSILSHPASLEFSIEHASELLEIASFNLASFYEAVRRSPAPLRRNI